jgi:hypothetical protein
VRCTASLPDTPAVYITFLARAGTSTLECAATQVQGRALSSYAGSSVSDAPPAAGSSNISFKVSADGGNVVVDVKAGKASAKATYPANSIRQ